MRDTALAASVAAFITVGIPREAIAALPFGRATGTRLGNDTVTYPIPPADGVQIDETNQVILTRWKGAIYAFALSCPHQRAALRWDDADKRFQCPKHRSKYQPDGTFISGRATRNMDRYNIRRDKESVIVTLTTLYKNSDNQTAWNAAVVSDPSTSDSLSSAPATAPPKAH